MRKGMRQGVADLGSLIGTAEPARLQGEARFVASALRAAGASRAAHRSRILSDLADMLGCADGQLDFLFDTPRGAANDRDPLIMPDYRDALVRHGEQLAAE